MERNSREYWNARARYFPRFEEGERNYEARLLEIIHNHGVDFQEKQVLDVGAGSGMYTIRIARQAKHVVAVDIADEMLRILAEDAKKQALNNITCVLSDWHNFHADQKYEIVFASMTPAIKSDADREKLMALATEWVVFMGFAERYPSDVMQGLYEHYGITPKIFDNAPRMRVWLEHNKIPYQVEPVHEKWSKPRTFERLIMSCSDSLQDYGVSPEQSFLQQYLQKFKDASGSYVERSEHHIEVITWKPS